ncbi:interferon-inducible GTPase 1-like isoform X2 [Mercenaria mercenaria]|nr:interferon-inducible GTPase 1-like isoform X2 [Mercenaria mercenaria]
MQEFGIFKGLCHYVADNVEDWKEKYVKIAIAGNSGTGKSSLINTLRGMRPGDKGAAKVGVTETTTEAVSYRFPNNDRIRIFDLPGMGTIHFPRQNYMEDMKVSTYDAFIIVTSERITENDVWFTKEIMSKNRHVCFVRTKIDTELANEKKDNPKGFVKEKCLAEMRNEIITTLKKELGPEKLCGIYLLSSRDKDRYDFPKLTDALQSHLNILGRAIRKFLGEHIKLVIDEKRELNKGGFLPQKIWQFMSGFSVPHTHKLSRDMEKIRLICLREFCLDNMSLELVSNETGISVDDLKAKLRTFKQDEDKAKKSGFQRVAYVMRYYHAMQRNLANMCDDMASDEMCLVNLKLDRVEEELSPLLSK